VAGADAFVAGFWDDAAGSFGAVVGVFAAVAPVPVVVAAVVFTAVLLFEDASCGLSAVCARLSELKTARVEII